MPYSLSKRISRAEPVVTFVGGSWTASVDYNYEIRDTSVENSTASGTISELSVDLRVPLKETLLPSSFSADTTFGKLVSVNGKVVKQAQAGDLSAPAFVAIDALTRKIALSSWEEVGEVNKFKLTSLASRVSELPIDALSFRLPVAPIKAGSVQILATLTAASGADNLNIGFNQQGLIEHPSARGFIDYQTGLVSLRFVKRIDLTGESKGYKLASSTSSSSSGSSSGTSGSGADKKKDSSQTASSQYSYNRTYEYWGVEHKGELYMGSPTEVGIGGTRIYGFEPLLARAETIRYNATGYTYLPLDKDILGVDTVKLPPSGKVPAYRKGDLILIKAQKEFPIPNTTLNTPISVGKSRLSLLEIVDSLGVKVSFDKYSIDLDAGTFTFTDLFVPSAYLPPFKALYHYQDMAVASDVSISGDIKLTKQLTHDFNPVDTLVSSALLMGTLQARVYNLFTQAVWSNKFLSFREGDDSIFKYDVAVAPIIVTNESCIQEDWALVFTNSTTFDLIGRNVGKVASGSSMEDFSPLNPVTGKPLMILKKEGFSTGAKTGNVLRFTTNAANFPVWVVRTILQSSASSLDHNFSLEFKGNRDRVL